MAFRSPNYTQVPNDLFDTHMAHMGEAELKVVLAAVRKVIGFHKTSDPISITQFMEMTGLSRQGVIDGVDAAVKNGHLCIAGRGKRGVTVYSLAIEEYPVYTDDQSNSLTTTSQPSRPVLVNQVDPQKKERKGNKKDSSPKGDGPPAKEDSPSKSSKRDAYNDLVEAAVVAFKTSPAYARKIVAFLRNTLSDTDNRGRANDAWIEYMTEPKREITPALIRGFGQYWLTRHSDVSRPSSPEAIANNWHRYLMDESQAQFEKDGQLAIDLAAAKAAQAAAAAVETETAATAATDGKVGTVEEQNAIFDRLLEAMRRFTE